MKNNLQNKREHLNAAVARGTDRRTEQGTVLPHSKQNSKQPCKTQNRKGNSPSGLYKQNRKQLCRTINRTGNSAAGLRAQSCSTLNRTGNSSAGL
jgi:hypothetical protein